MTQLTHWTVNPPLGFANFLSFPSHCSVIPNEACKHEGSSIRKRHCLPHPKNKRVIEMSSLDYSRFDNIGAEDSDLEDSDQKDAKEVRKTAWGPLEQLKKIADGLFEVAEKDSSLESYKRALQHYDELLPRIQELQRADPSNLDKGYHMTVSCHLNACCCFMRAGRWSEANERCCLVLVTSKAKGHKLTPIEEMRTRYFRIMCAIPLLQQHTKTMEQYRLMGIENVNDHEANECFEALQDDGEELARLLLGGHVSTNEQQQYVDALEKAHDAVEKFGNDGGEDVEDVDPSSLEPHHQHAPTSENLDYDFSHTGPEAVLSTFKISRDQALTQAAKSYREGRFEEGLRMYEEALTAGTSIRVNLKIALKKEQKEAGGNPDASTSPYQQLVVENERIAGAAGAGKGVCLAKLGRYEAALSPLVKAAKALESLRDDKAVGSSATAAAAAGATKKHLWTCLESLSDCYSRLLRWPEALESADRLLRLFRSDKPNKRLAGVLLARAHMLASLQEHRQSLPQSDVSGHGCKHDASAEAVALAWQSAGSAFKDLDMHADAYSAFCKAGETLTAPGVAVSPGGIHAFADILIFPESSADVVDADMAELAHAMWSSGAREAGKLAESLLASAPAPGTATGTDTEGKVEHYRAVLRALHDQLQAWFEAGMCGMCSATPSLAVRAFEAASSARDRYEMELAAGACSGSGEDRAAREADLVGGQSGYAALFLNLGDLAFHFGHALIRTGADKCEYALEEAASSVSFYDKAEKDHGADVEEVTRRRRLAWSLQALALTFLGRFEEADAAVASIGESSPPGTGEEQMASVRRMVTRRCPRSRERVGVGTGAGSQSRPTPVVAASKPPTGLTRMRMTIRAMYARTLRALDAFLSFITGDHWTSVLAAWALVLLTLLCIALLFAASAGIVTLDTQEL